MVVWFFFFSFFWSDFNILAVFIYFLSFKEILDGCCLSACVKILTLPSVAAAADIHTERQQVPQLWFEPASANVECGRLRSELADGTSSVSFPFSVSLLLNYIWVFKDLFLFEWQILQKEKSR